MTRFIALAFALTLALSGVLGTAAQEATPPATADPFAGVTLEPLGGIVPQAAPDSTLSAIRITMEPGSLIPAHRHPGAVILRIVDGSFGTTFVEGEGQITRAAVDGTPQPAETIAAGDDAVLNPGDVLTYEGAVHTMANAGDEPLVLLATVLLATDQPAFIFQMDMGTPAP